MKKLLLGIITLLAFHLSYGQSFTTQHGDTSTGIYQNPGPTVSVYNLITNTSATNIQIKWKLLPNNGLTNGWSLDGFCDNMLCYNNPTSATTQTSDDYEPNNQEDFHAIFKGDLAPANSSAWIQVATDDQNGYLDTFTFVATKGPLNVTTVVKSDDDVVLYPNPARSNVNVIFNASLGVKNIAVYNLIGKAVSIYKVSGNSAKLELNEIPAGIYFVRLMNSKGQIVATRKFTKQ